VLGVEHSKYLSTPQHQQTEATLAQHLALALTTASVAMQLQLSSGGIIFDRACRHIIYKSLFTENTVASKEKKTQQRKDKYNSNKVHDSR